MAYLKWFWWSLRYLFRPQPVDVDFWLVRSWRTRPPWWKFTPHVWHNEDGRQWEVYLSEESVYTERRTIAVDVHISQETGDIVGFTVRDETLKCSESSQ